MYDVYNYIYIVDNVILGTDVCRRLYLDVNK